jgi:hypothetical protein
MGFRSYLPKLAFLLRLVCKYMLKWQPQIKEHLGGGANEAAYDACLTACQVLIAVLDVLIPNPS